MGLLPDATKQQQQQRQPDAASNSAGPLAPSPPAVYGDRALFERKLRALRGAERLQVIVDFDRTVTRARRAGRDGEANPSCHRVLEQYSGFPQSYERKSRALFEQYYPVEVDHDVPHADKYAAMQQWWERAHALFLSETGGVAADDVPRMVREAAVELREGVLEFFERCAAAGVPLLVFSAGVADVIEEVLRTHALLLPNVRVIGNRLRYASTGDGARQVVGFEPPLIHTLNKNEAAAAHFGAGTWEALQHRPHVLLLGDSLGDLHMSNGVRGATVLSIGFLNDAPDARDDGGRPGASGALRRRRAAYVDAFDAVVLGDGDFSVPNRALAALLGDAAAAPSAPARARPGGEAQARFTRQIPR